MTVMADQALGIPCRHYRPLQNFARLGLFIALGLVAAALLFLLDSVLVERAHYNETRSVPVKLVEFVRIERDETVRIRERRLPPKPRPADPLRPPEKLRVTQSQAAQQVEIDFEMPDVEAGLAGGAGPWLGAYVPRRGTEGMHDGDILPIVRIEPQYPRQALIDGLEGWVHLRFTILEDGGVSDVEVVDARPRGVFEKNAVRAVMRWKFRPRIENGQAVRRLGAQVIEFRLLQDE